MIYVRSTTGLWALLLMSAGLKFFVAPFTVLLAFYVEGHLKASPDWYGFLVAGMGLGMIAGFVISGAVKLESAPERHGDHRGHRRAVAGDGRARAGDDAVRRRWRCSPWRA